MDEWSEKIKLVECAQDKNEGSKGFEKGMKNGLNYSC